MKSSYPHFWHRFFDIENKDTPEAITRNFIVQAVYTGLKGRRPPGLRALLREDAFAEIKVLAHRRYSARFPEKEAEEELKRLEEEKLFARRARNKDGQRLQKTEYRVLLNRIKVFKARRKEFREMHRTLRGRLRTPNYLNFVLKALRGEISEDSNTARLAILFVMGHWLYRIDELVKEATAEEESLQSLVDKYYNRHVASKLRDEREKVVVREAIRCVDGLLPKFGDYIERFYHDCMFCSFNTRGNSDLDKSLLYMFPGLQMKQWLSFHNYSTVGNMLKMELPNVFPFDLNPDPKRPSNRRIIGLSARAKVRYQPLAAMVLKVLQLRPERGRAAHFNGLYLDQIMRLLVPYLKDIPPFEY